MALLPGWIIAGGWIPLAVIGVILIVVCVNAGTAYGAPDGWSLFLAPALPPAAWLWSSFTRRTEELELRKRLKLQVPHQDHGNRPPALAGLRETVHPPAEAPGI